MNLFISWEIEEDDLEGCCVEYLCFKLGAERGRLLLGLQWEFVLGILRLWLECYGDDRSRLGDFRGYVRRDY
jgi:hypothetical protein